MKASSNSGGIKNMLLQHVEKIVLGVAVILVALFLWSAMGVKPIDASKAPEKLLAAANSEKQRIETSALPEGGVPVADIDFENAMASASVPVSVNHYMHSLKLNPDIQPPIVKRPEPKLFPVEDIRATAMVISVPEYGTPPVWKEPEKAKKAAKKERPGLDPQKQRPRRRGRNQAGYGQTAEAGYGGTGPTGYGATGADRSAPGAGYGAAGGAQTGYGQAGGGKAGYGGTGGNAGARAEGGSAAGYGAPGAGYGGAGHGGAGYGGAGYGGAGVSGARPGVDISSNPAAQGVVYPAVVLTGRVPYETQWDEFQKKFKGTVPLGTTSAEQDIPVYMQFKLERQEITPAGDAKWVALDLNKAIEDEASWAVQATDLVDNTYVDQFLAWPLPPTLVRDWGRLASHPSIPFVWMAEEVAAPTTFTLTEEERQMRIQERRGTVQLPGNTGYGTTGDGRGPVGYGAGAPGTEMAMVAPVPYKLFRFVDTQNIEPGKEYRYRVSLELQNPNYLAPPLALEEPTSAQQATRWTEPAESPSVTVPGKSFLYALGLKKSQSDYEGQVLFHVWNEKMGAEIAKEFDIALGAIADFIETVDDWYNPYTNTGEKLENVHFAFKDGPPMLADITGGVEVPGFRDLDQPTEMLFIDANGRMFTSNQARGTPAAEFYKERYTSETAPDPGAEQFAPGAPGLIQQPTGGNYGGSR